MIFCARSLRSVPSFFNSLYPLISCRRARLNTRRRIVTCVRLILYPAMSSIGTPRCEGFSNVFRRFSSSIGSSLIIPVVSFSSICIFFLNHLSSAFTARCSPLIEADVIEKSSMNVPHRITYGIFFPLRVDPSV